MPFAYHLVIEGMATRPLTCNANVGDFVFSKAELLIIVNESKGDVK